VRKKLKYFVVLFLLILYKLSFSQSFLPEEYVLLSQYLKTKDDSLGERILREYPNAVFSEDLKLMLSEEAYKRGNVSKAKEYLQSINPDRLRPDLLGKYAELWKSLDLDKKRALLNNPVLFREFVGSVELSKEERLSVAERLSKRGYYADMIRLLDGYEKDKSACYYLGLSYLKTGQRERGEEILLSCPDDRAYVELARLYLNERDEGKLRDVLLMIKNDEVRNEVLFIAGRIFLYSGDYERSKEYFSSMSDNYDKFFNLGLLSFIGRDYERALKQFMRAYYSAKSPVESSQASFWVYKTYQAMGREDTALRYLVLATKGEGFYSAEAGKLLGERVAHRGVRRVLSEGDFPTQANVIKAIRDAGFYYYSRLEAFKRISLMSPSDIIALSKFDPFLAIRLAVRKYGSRSEVYNLVAYPTPYESYVYEAGQRFNIEPELIWAVMRQESLFDPFAVSRSGAKGLMQLMDKTAQWKAQKLRINIENIFEPRTNILLGTAYLRYLYDLWEGDVVKVLASYNAGEGRVKRWKDYEDKHLFIETIPIKETRDYVRRVLYNYYVYKDLLE